MNPDAPVPYLRGEKVFLAPPEPEHAEDLCRWLNDPGVWISYGMDMPVSVEGERQWIASLPSREDELNLLIFEKESGRPVGLAGLRNIDGFNGTARLGVMIGESTQRRSGFGSEAVRLLIDHAFKYLGLRRISLAVLANNEAALKMYRRIGFREEGRERQAQLRNGDYVDRLHFGLLRKEYGAADED